MSKKSSGADQSEAENRALIQIVKCNDWIFRKDKRFTHNDEMRAQLWEQIRTTLAMKGLLIIDPKTRWQKLRDQFTRHDKTGNYKWLYYEDMEFMLEHIKHRNNAAATSAQAQSSRSTGKPNPSSSSTMHLDTQSPGHEASNVEPSQESPIWTIPSCARSVENSAQPLEPIAEYTLNWEHSYAIAEIPFTVDEIPPSDCTTEDNSTSQSEHVIETPVPSAIGNCTPNVEHGVTTPTTSRTNVVPYSTSVRASHAKRSPIIAVTPSTSQRPSPVAGTPVNHKKRSSVVPPLDAFAKKKKTEAARTSDAAENAIIECSNKLKSMSVEFTDLLRLKKKLVKSQLQTGKNDVGIPQTSRIVESGDGFFQLLQEEWVQLPLQIQDELLPHMLDIMEGHEAE